MRTKEITVYKFSELSDKAKKKALDKLSDINVSHDWWDYIYDDAATIGLKIEEFDIDRGSYVKGKFTLDAIEVAAKIKENHGEECETYKDAEAFLISRDAILATWPTDANGEFENSDDLDETLDEIEEDFFKKIREYYRTLLSKEYDYQTSEKQIIESIEANEYEFTEDGKLSR
jgi:hypothetical protein